MAGVASGGWGDSRPHDGVLSKIEGGENGEALTEWWSSEQLDSETPSTSSPFWGIDNDNDDCGLRPSELYGKYKWELNEFSQINKRELRSKAFEVGGYKWYILMYPQGCDVCNHLSLFLCVDSHDKLLPGWSHFAQFTIAMVNKTDPKKSKQSDTLHRFWKKEHDWGWKKFLELSKVLDAIDSDTLTIEAQVQVIREKASRPFRCLDCRYRRELVSVYIRKLEQIFHLFVEERRSKLGNLIEDKARWSSFCAFWLRVDQKSRHTLTREKTDSTLRVVVKELFIEKEVTSTLVMDSLYSGLKTLEGQTKIKQGPHKLVGMDGLTVPVVRVEQDMFVLDDDVLLLLERAALDPVPPKDVKGPQNHMKDGSSGDDSSKGSIESDERRLTELGRRTIEISVLAHIFSKIEVAYQEDIALARQEELIREEAAWLETEQKSKRVAADKEKKPKKKQAKQKRNNRKGKEKGRDDDVIAKALYKVQLESVDESKDSLAEEAKPELPNPETCDDISDESDTVDHLSEVLLPDSEEREASPVDWDTDTSEVCGGASPLSDIQNGIRETSGSCTVVDDSSSTCSTDSVPSVVMNGSYKPNPLPNHNSHRSPAREWKQRGRATSDMSGWVNEGNIRSSNAKRDVGPQNGSYGSRKADSEPDTATESLHDKIKNIEPPVVKRQIVSHQMEPSIKHQADKQRSPKEKTTIAPSSPISSSKNTPHPIQPKLEAKITAPPILSIKRPLSDNPQLPPVRNSADVAVSSKLEHPKPQSPPKSTQKPLIQQVRVLSRPLSAPIVHGPKPSTPVVSVVQSQPLIFRSVSAVGQLAPEPTPMTHHQSYENAMRGNNFLSQPNLTSLGYAQPQSPNTALNLSQHYPTPANTIYPSIVPAAVYRPPMQNDNHALDIFKQVKTESPACISGRQSNAALTDEFPHLDIINDLLDDEYGNANISTSTSFQNFNNVSPHLHRQYSYSGDIGATNDMLVGPSTSSSRFEQTHSYHEPMFQPSYSSLGGQFESTRDFYPQQNLTSFPNGQIDGLVPNQWQVAGSDLSYLNTNSGVHLYQIPDYYNLPVNSNGYSVFRPSNGQ